MEAVKIGILGCGGIARSKHLPELQKIEGVEIIGFYDPIKSRAQECAEKFGNHAKVYETAGELLADPGIDAVHICTPNNTHAELAVHALENHKHVMCEKPMAINGEQSYQMEQAAQKSGKILTVGYQSRFEQRSLYLKRLCGQGELGEIYYGKAHAVRRRGVPTWGSFLNSDIQGGGCLIDMGTHTLDLTLWLMDNYEPEYAVCNIYHKLGKNQNAANVWGPWNSEKFLVEDSAFGFIRMKNGATVEIDCSWALNIRNAKESVATLCGTKAGADMLEGLTLNGEKEQSLYVNHIDVTNTTGISLDIPYSDNPNQMETEDWIQAIRTGREPLVKFHEAAVVCRIIDGMYQSAKTHQPYYF